jgi:hypothetical protein
MDDAVIIAYIVKRTPGNSSALDSLKQQIEETVKRQRVRILFEDFQDYLLKQAKFEDRVQAAAVAEEGAESTNQVPQEEMQSPDDSG